MMTLSLNRGICPTLPLSVKKLNFPRVVGSSCGLLCLYGYDTNYTPEMFVIWNPSIRKSIVVAMPDHSFVAFGVCPVTHDPNIVSITQSSRSEADIKTKATIYTLSSAKWTSLTANLPTKRIRDWCVTAVVTDRFIYWRAGTQTHNMIVSFDLTNESFEAIDLPDNFACRDSGDFSISKLRESLAILEYGENISTVWMMEDGVQKSFTKLSTIMTPHDFIVGLRRNGLPIIVADLDDDDDDDVELSKLVAYGPNFQHNTVLEISESYCTINMNSYVETLVLLGRSDCISY